MKKMMMVAALAVGLVLMSMPAFALELGTNITIWDGSGLGNSALYGGEDGEVEPGCQTGQDWDLEGFFLKGDTLTMVGGYDFKNGYENTTSGDIFLDINGDYIAGDAPSTIDGVVQVANSYGWDYALDLNFSNSKFTVYSLDEDSQLNSVFYVQNQGSTPWEYKSGATATPTQYSFDYFTGSSALSDTETGFDGVTHNAVAIDLGFLDPGTDFTAHFTMTCGNDNLMGQGTAPVPEPQTLLLMGIGLLGLAFVGRKKLGKRA